MSSYTVKLLYIPYFLDCVTVKRRRNGRRIESASVGSSLDVEAISVSSSDQVLRSSV